MFDQQQIDASLQASKMERTRLQQKGDLYEQGGWWKLRWREDRQEPNGSLRYAWTKPVSIGPSDGRGRLTKLEARRIAWENFLSRLDQNNRTPQSIVTVAEFVERRFIPEHVAMLKKAGREHYKTALPHVLDGIPEKRRSFKGHKKGQELPEIKRRFGIGTMRLRDVRNEHVQRLVSEAIQKSYSVQTARHIRNCCSAIFTCAEEKEWFTGKNPARFVKLPEMTRRPVTALSFEQLQALLFGLKPVANAMVLCASLTSMNIAEVCGLRWKRVNLTAQPVIVDGETIPPFHLAVREQWYLREFGTVKAAARRRNVPMATLLVEALQKLATARFSPSSEAVVFEGRNGRPLDAIAILRRQVRKVAVTVGVPNLGWHDLRRTFATLADQLGMTMGERKALMGHARVMQTLEYTHTHSKEAVAALERMGEKVGRETVN